MLGAATEDAAARNVGRRDTIVPVLCIVAVAAGGFLLSRDPAPRLEIFGPIVYALASFGDLATAVVLLATWRRSPGRLPTFVLMLTFAVSAPLMVAAMLTMPLLPNVLPVVPASPQSGLWLFVAWHVTAGVGAVIYARCRAIGNAHTLSRRFVTEAVVIATAYFAVVMSLALTYSDHLPRLTPRALFSSLGSSGVGPVTITLLLVAAIFVFRVRGRTATDRALGFALIALALDVLLLLAGGPRNSAAFYAGRAALLLGASFVFIASVQILIRIRARVGETEWKLICAEDESAKRAGRIRALWQITQDETLSQQERFDGVLAKATEALRPGKPMFGCLTHLEGDIVVVDSISWNSGESLQKLADTVFPGATIPLQETMQSIIYAEGRTKAWDDLSAAPGVSGRVCQQVSWRSCIGTPVNIGRQTHFLVFTSPETTLDDPFTADDIAYVEIVAAFFASRFSQQMQFERIQFQIEHDALTGLANRVEFRKAIREAIAGGTSFAVAFIDLDGFRHVNEMHGHQVGDEVLVEVASSLTAVVPGDFVARMAGDEFGVLLHGATTEAAAAAMAGRYAARFQQPFHTGDRLGTQMLRVGASIGAARFPADGGTAEELMLRADAALAAAKQHGGSSTRLFDAQLDEQMAEAHVRVVELADAIAGDQLALAYQPTFDLATRRIVGAEALVRWDHPERGRLLPADFVPLAERNDLITPLSRWVLARLVRDLALAPALPKGFRVYFNLTAQTLGDVAFISELKSVLQNSRGLAEHVGVEMTESAAMDDIEGAAQTIDLFRKWGLFVAIDDFGTGYSSMSYLKKLRVDVIKIDRSFVTGLPGDERDAAIAEMLLRITDRFGFATLAEGIETEAQATWLLNHGCRAGQGHYFAKPGPFAALLRRLALAPKAVA